MKVLGRCRERIRESIRAGRVRFAVYGLGKMGLPLAAVLAQSGSYVTGVDIDPQVVSQVNDGGCPLSGEPGLAELVRRMTDAGRLRATSDGEMAAAAADVMVVLVPVLLVENKGPDLSAVTSACRTISRHLVSGDLVIIETTVPPRTTESVILPILLESGLSPGDFGLAFCPERASSGHALRDITGAYPKVVGGVDAVSREAASAIYEVINTSGVTATSDTTTAEAVKLFECIYRDVSIAFVNELALLCEELGIDSAEVIARAGEPVDDATGCPFVTLLKAGAGVGGHCIPVYPYFVTHSVDTPTEVIPAARRRNEAMPAHVVDIVRTALDHLGRRLDETRVLVVGLCFRPGVRETRNSPGLAVARRLKQWGASVSAYDSLLSPDEIRDLELVPCSAFEGLDCIVFIHDCVFVGDVVKEHAGRMRTPLLVDCCGCVDMRAAAAAGFVCRRLGNGR
ncbi:MAG TPA: nucleotide sugar dehydrogenase [Dehalococcoidia bacterium]|nr:nucleotide sugar dehydrogenase [Dehalococcoidia bacterium]